MGILSLNLLSAETIEKRFNEIAEEVNKMNDNILLETFCNYRRKLYQVIRCRHFYLTFISVLIIYSPKSRLPLAENPEDD